MKSGDNASMLALEEKPSARITRRELQRVHYALQRGGFISEAKELAGGIAAKSAATPIPMWNHLAWLGEEEGDFEAFLRAGAAELAASNRRPVVYMAANDAEAAAALARNGYERFDQEAWMVFRGGHRFSEKGEGRIAGVRSENELEDFIRVFQASYQVKESGYAESLRRDQGGRMRHFVLYSGEKPVSICSLGFERGLACLYSVGTPPGERRKGYAGRMLGHVLEESLKEGAEAVFLQVEHESAAQRLYERFGFQTEFVRHGWRLKEWSPARAERPRLSALLGHRAEDGSAGASAHEAKPLPAELIRRIQAVSERHSAAVPELMCAAWAYLLHRWTGEERITLKCIREEGETGRQFEADRERPLLDWAGGADAALPFHLEYETALRFQPDRSAPFLAGSAAPLEVVFRGLDCAAFEIHYRTDFFGKEMIRRMAAHFTAILENFAEYPERKAGEIEILPPREKHQLLVEWNQPGFSWTEELLPRMFERQVEMTPDAAALVFAKAGVPDPADRMSFRELNHQANRLAHRLQKEGVGPEVFVGVCMERSLEMIVALLAILKAGGACVPLDPVYPRERIAFMLQDADVPVVLTNSNLEEILGAGSRRKVIALGKAREALALESEKNPHSIAGPENAAYMIYTSGSTGQPKGVVIPNGAIANHCVDCRRQYGLNPKDRVLQFSSFNFDASLEQILPALISGAALVVRDGEVWNTKEFSRKLREFELTVTDIPTAYWHELAEYWTKEPEAVPPNSVRMVIVGGEALSLEKLALWRETPLGRARLINAYGPTETTITAVSHEVPPRRGGEPRIWVLPIGRPRGDRKAYVLDRWGAPVPIGVPGELHIGGSMLARGYHNRPELTASRFIPNPFSDDPDARLYKTGDLARWLPDGNLEFLGRIDDQVKIRGFRVELGEIETTLRGHPAVREAIVMARLDAAGEKRLVGYVTSGNQPPEKKDLRRYLKDRLPDYMVPSGLVVLKEWPLMPNGKVDRRALPEPAEESAVAGGKGPENPLELRIQLIFERVLKRPGVGVDENFFELGGDSLQALELLVEVERATGKSLPLGILYQSSTVQALAREAAQRGADEAWSSLVPLQTGGKRPPLILLHTTPGDILAYGNLVYRLGPDQPCYGLQSLGLKDAALSHRSIAEMTEHYLERLRKLQPHGPYYLGGWCYGGIVAVEMARRLKEEGEEIALLALLETVAMPPSLANWRYYLHRLGCLLRMPPSRWAMYVRRKLRWARESRAAHQMRFRQAAAASMTGPIEDPRLAKLEHVYNANLEALKNYRSRYYDGKVTLFNAAEEDPALLVDPQYGWVGLAREIEVHEVPGDHDTMLSEPHVTALAAKLTECLPRAGARQERPSLR